jgi:hypothetical protein
MKQEKTTKLTALEKQQKKLKQQKKFNKQIEKVVWDIYENGQQYHRGGINE